MQDAYIRINSYRIKNSKDRTFLEVEYTAEVYASEEKRENEEQPIEFINEFIEKDELSSDVFDFCYDDLRSRFDNPKDV